MDSAPPFFKFLLSSNERPWCFSNSKHVIEEVVQGLGFPRLEIPLCNLVSWCFRGSFFFLPSKTRTGLRQAGAQRTTKIQQWLCNLLVRDASPEVRGDSDPGFVNPTFPSHCRQANSIFNHLFFYGLIQSSSCLPNVKPHNITLSGFCLSEK